MKKRVLISCIVLGLVLTGGGNNTWSKKTTEFTLPTQWTEEAFSAATPLPEYPRPQMKRAEWLNLNGEWDYMGGKGKPDPRTAVETPSFKKHETIRVPFAPEAELSGIGRKDETNLWYRRSFSIPEEWKSKKVLLNFGAVDRIASVFVNGHKVGSHTGGYDAFSMDITDYLKKGENTLVVGAYDPNDGRAASGKNGPRGDYTFSSGIWQTVWLEPVGKNHISQIRLIPDVEKNRVEVEVLTDSKEPLKVSAVATADGTKVASAEGKSNTPFYLPVANPRLWSPDSPFLYGLKLELKDRSGKVVDDVESYFGMRSVGMKEIDGVMRPTLNGEFVFQIGLLDQGYWPDGVFTAPTDEALKSDIELARRAGFNVIRKHIKVEPQRWYHYCDSIGLMVWQDMPNLWEPDGEDSVMVRSQFREEMKRMIDQHMSSPSIVMWVPFNENWGAFEATDIADMVKKHDPMRLVNANSGFNYAPGYRKAYGDPGNGDFVDRHHYGKLEPKALPQPTEARAASLGEFGGKGLFVRGHMWPVRNDAYEMMISRDQLTDTYVMLLTELEQMVKYFGLSTAIYTQTTDVEHEINGLVTYDRAVEKMDLDKVRDINRSVIESTRRK